MRVRGPAVSLSRQSASRATSLERGEEGVGDGDGIDRQHVGGAAGEKHARQIRDRDDEGRHGQRVDEPPHGGAEGAGDEEQQREERRAGKWRPVSRSSTAMKTPAKAMTEPTERSIAARQDDTVMPTATMPRYALSVRRLPITRVDSMAGNCR